MKSAQVHVSYKLLLGIRELPSTECSDVTRRGQAPTGTFCDTHAHGIRSSVNLARSEFSVPGHKWRVASLISSLPPVSPSCERERKERCKNLCCYGCRDDEQLQLNSMPHHISSCLAFHVQTQKTRLCSRILLPLAALCTETQRHISVRWILRREEPWKFSSFQSRLHYRN